ncbi:permease-like cell division protein FtsX [Patescibacteria group bacterium]|nr:permease-like cell division protein FtsX [Patescibacteria group bacterium]MBU1722147.1 permease-like cell division protein FtsX [Patescibacteria group bacterium]MBU1901196.1 permease-like cell division protein FtsX [Patescibacteria group bacterium]
MLSFFRVIKFAFQDMGRNFSLSLMTVVILILMLLSMNTVIVVRALTQEAVSTVKNQIDVSVYFVPTATDEQVEEVKAYVSSFPEVVSLTFLDKDKVLEQFKETHKENENIIASIDELDENPLGPTMIVKTREPSDYQKLITALTIPEYEDVIEAKTFGDTEQAIDRISVITAQVEKAVWVLSGLFLVIAFFVIFNTIRVAIYTQRIEIGIKKLVGATNWFIQGPYIMEAFFFTCVSVASSYGLVYMATKFLDPYVSVIFGGQYFLTNYFESNILLLIGSQFIVVLLLTIITSGLAMRKYLRV